MPVEIRVTPWIPLWWDDVTYAAVRVWQEFDGRHWYQCHEWEYKGGNRQRWAEDWINGVRGWSINALPPTPGDDPPP